MSAMTYARATALVSTLEDKPTTTSRLIAEKFGKRHKNVLQRIDELVSRNLCSEAFFAANFSAAKYTDERGKEQPEYRITEEGFMMLAMGFTGPAAAKWREQFIAAFQFLRRHHERQLKKEARKAQAEARAKVAKGNSLMCTLLETSRAMEGKKTKPHHYMNEQRLINWCLTGRHSALNRDALTPEALDLMVELERLNGVYIVRGKPYAWRKKKLAKHVRKALFRLVQDPDEASSTVLMFPGT